MDSTSKTRGKSPATSDRSPAPQRPQPTAVQGAIEDVSASNATLRPDTAIARYSKKKRNHRGGLKKKRTRKQSFAITNEDGASQLQRSRKSHNAPRSSFYRMQGGNLSEASIDSQALLDHREQQSIRQRRSSTVMPSAFGQQSYDTPTDYRTSSLNKSTGSPDYIGQSCTSNPQNESDNGDDHGERTPLISRTTAPKNAAPGQGYGPFRSPSMQNTPGRTSSYSSSRSRKKTIFDTQSSAFPSNNEEYNINYPPSVPGSPQLGASKGSMSFGDMLARDHFDPARGSPQRDDAGDSLLSETGGRDGSMSPRRDPARRHTVALHAEEDVCFPLEDMSEIAEGDTPQQDGIPFRRGARRRKGMWPDLEMLDEWSRFEKEGRSEERRAKKITEPHLIGGRLRPIHKGWHRAEDDAPYRFTYFNEEFQSTIHSQTISELVQPGGSFRELFIPDPPELSDGSDSEDEHATGEREIDPSAYQFTGINGASLGPTRQGSIVDASTPIRGGSVAGTETPSGHRSKSPGQISASPRIQEDGKSTRYGERPTWWLDVLSPTDAEMKVISKVFGIHPLTAEDIMMQEAREKVELFRNYYFVNYRTFEQDMNSADFLEPVNMYVVVFREGVISFHFSMTPHPANVRRRIRQLQDYLILSSDWISYAIIDDITDVFAPLIQSIEDEVDDIDDAILKLHSTDTSEKSKKDNERSSEAGVGTSGESGSDMLRRVGDCRKKVMGLYRLLGNKADVIKGFAKRCNEHWEIAPRSEIGLYLGDIQDHIVTMTGNLSHYEKILARSHGNYLAQINIRMNERQEQTADVLGKLTVLGTIVLPMNIITGLWGMNVWVPGQSHQGNQVWFWCITMGLLAFGFGCFFIAKRIYRIV